MSSLKSTFLNFINADPDFEKKWDFANFLMDYFEVNYPDLNIGIVKHLYAPECFQTLSESKPGLVNKDKLIFLKTNPFPEKGEFVKHENLLVVPLCDQDNQVHILIIFENCPEDIYNDLTSTVREIKDLYKFFCLQYKAISNSNDIKQANLVSRIAHDINSLIALIPEEFTKDVALTTRIKYSENLSRDIMYYLRELSIEKSMVPIEDLINGIISGIQIPSNIHINKRYSDSSGLITVDVELMDRALSAIIENSVFATQIEGGEIEVITKTNKNESPYMDYDWLEIQIADTGSGIPNEFLNDVKNPLFTTWKDQGHVGLGLSIAKNIIQAHNGSLNIKSNVGQGTSITVHLPMR